LKWAVGKTCRPSENEAFCALWEEAKGRERSVQSSEFSSMGVLE